MNNSGGGRLLILHRCLVARAAHPPGILLILWPGPPLSGCIENFWDAGDALETFPIYLHKKPELEAAALKRLGPSLFRIGNKDLSDLLVPVYPKAREYVLHELKRWNQNPVNIPPKSSIPFFRHCVENAVSCYPAFS